MSGNTFDFVEVGSIERALHHQQKLLINVSRGLDKLAGRRQSAERQLAAGNSTVSRGGGGEVLVAEIASQVAHRSGNVELAKEIKAAVLPATTTTTGYAAELTGAGSLAGLVLGLQRRSAAAGILAKSPQVSLLEKGAQRVVVAGEAPAAVFVAEGAPIPVFQGAVFEPLTMTPAKLAAIVHYTAELQRSSDIENITRMLLQQSVAAGLDEAFFAATAPGLLTGLSAEGASAATDPLAAITADLSTLLGALTSPSPDVTFVMSPAQYLLASALLPPSFGYALAQSSALPVGTVVAIDPLGVAAAIGEPAIKVSGASTIHESDTPLALGTAGSPNTVAAPMRSFFQTDSVGARIVFFVAWVARAGAVSFMDSAAW